MLDARFKYLILDLLITTCSIIRRPLESLSLVFLRWSTLKSSRLLFITLQRISMQTKFKGMPLTFNSIIFVFGKAWNSYNIA